MTTWPGLRATSCPKAKLVSVKPQIARMPCKQRISLPLVSEFPFSALLLLYGGPVGRISNPSIWSGTDWKSVLRCTGPSERDTMQWAHFRTGLFPSDLRDLHPAKGDSHERCPVQPDQV